MFDGLFLRGSHLLADTAHHLWFPEQASTYAAESDGTYSMILWISLAFFIPLAILMVYFPIKYYQRKGGKATSRVTHHNVLEVTWTIVPCIFLVIMFVRGSWGYLDMATPPEGAKQVDLTAFKWGWSMNYGKGAIHPELHVVLNQPTKVVMRSTDVLHSFFIPAFRLKQDVVPGRYITAWFQATTPTPKVSQEEYEAALAAHEESGDEVWDYDRYQMTPDGYRYFDLFCAEYCGRDHSAMQSYVVVHETQESWDEWIRKISSRGETPLAEYGEKLYQLRNCIGCHSNEPNNILVGPTFHNLYGYERQMADGETVLADEQYIRESILDPKAKVVMGFQPQMPSFKGQLSDDDIASLIAYMKTLSDRGETASEAALDDDAAAADDADAAAAQPVEAIAN